MTQTAFATLLAVVASLNAAAVAAAEITALDPRGQPAAEVAVTCTRGADAIVLTDARGRCTVPAACRRVQCQRGGWIAGEAEIVGNAVDCRLGDALAVRGRVEPPGATDCLSVALQARSRSVFQTATVCPSEGTAERSFRIDGVPPGAYDLVLLRTRDFWTCRTPLAALEAGEREVVAVWREPAEVRGTVLDPGGNPFRKVLLKVTYEPDDTLAVVCAIHPEALDVVSDASGAFRALVDPARAWSLVADPAWRPATVRIDRTEVRP